MFSRHTLASRCLWFEQARDAISTTPCTFNSTDARISSQELMRLAVPLVVMQALIFLGSQADVWIAGRELTPETVAHFAAAKRISVFITLPLQLAQLTTVASIAQLYAQGERQKLQRLLQRAGTLAFLPATVITLQLCLRRPGCWKSCMVHNTLLPQHFCKSWRLARGSLQQLVYAV